jgi:N6-adenosine-specific RNA methylase IME4
MTDVLALRDNAKHQLAQIKDIETGVEYLNKVKAIEVWAKAEKKDAELQNVIAEQKLRTQRILGGLLKTELPKGRSVTGDDTLSLNSIGINRNQSSAFQKIASLPQEIFEEEILTAKEESSKRIELTTSRMLKAAKVYDLSQKQKKWEEKTEQKPITDKYIDIYSTQDKFRVIYADPAWSYNDKQNTPNLGGAEKHYGTMSNNDIYNLPVNNITEKDAVLFLWVTSPLLKEGLQTINSWGFNYKTSFIWDKVQHNMGHYNSVRHEFLLVATKGNCTPDNKKLHNSVQRIEKSNRHSEKPIEFLDIIDELYNYGNKIELFCRDIKKQNWYGWGNEL